MELDKEMFNSLLNERLSKTDIKLVKQDVEPFLKDVGETAIWSNDYFRLLIDRIKYLPTE